MTDPCRVAHSEYLSAKWVICCSVAALSLSSMQAQLVASAAAPTLEIPTLVVDHNHRPAGDLRADQFRIQIDDLPPFAPMSVHVQDKEPVTLSIVIDASRDSYHDLAQLGDELSGIAGTMFLPQDRVSIYGLDCTMPRSLFNAPASPEALRHAVALALAYPKLHDQSASPNCGKSVHLWDQTAAAVSTLSKLPGRRVLLLITSGHDGGSHYTWQTVQEYATDQDVAIFAIRNQLQVDADTFTPGGLSTHRGFDGPTNRAVPETRAADDIQLLCANAGGVVLNAQPMHRNETLAYVLFIVRNRTILDIPAAAYPPVAPGAPAHKLKVTAPQTPFFVGPAGIGPALSTQ